MAETVYLTHNDPVALPAITLMRAAFPSYAGRRFQTRVATTVNVASSWDGGTRDFYAFVNLATGDASGPVPQQSAFDRPIPGVKSVPLVDGLACVKHTIFCGEDLGLTLILSPSNGPRFLPVSATVTETEALVLVATATLKNSYGGETDIRFTRVNRECVTTRESWAVAVSTLKARKLLTRQGAITPEGRNAVADHPMRHRLA
jgi:hypothetical protein